MTPNRALIPFVVGLMALAFSTDSAAAVVQLKNGQKIEGEYVGGTPADIRVKVGSQEIHVHIGEIASVVFDASAARTAVPASEFQSTARETLRQLRAVSAVTEAGVAYREYSTRVLDAKVAVSEFLREYGNSPSPAFSGHIEKAMCLYTEGSKAWSAHISTSLDHVPSDSCIRQCKASALEPVWKAERDEGFLWYALVQAGLSGIWQCAENEITAAETQLANGRGTR